MKTAQRIVLFWFILMSVALPVWAQDGGSEDKLDTQLVTELYQHSFTQTIRDGDAESLRGLFLTQQLPLHVIHKSRRGPLVTSNGLSGWLNLVASNPNYEILVDEPEVILVNNAAVTIAQFDEQSNSLSMSTGTDVFLHIKTEAGWQIATMNVTLLGSRDHNDYSVAHEFENDIETVITSISDAINDGDPDTFLRNFVDKSVYYLVVDDLQDSEFDPSEHTVAIFSDKLTLEHDTWQVDFGEPSITIYDQYLGVVQMDYIYTEGDEVVETGQQIWTLVATARDGWQITAVSIVKNDETQNVMEGS